MNNLTMENNMTDLYISKLSKISSFKENFKNDYLIQIENQKFRFIRINKNKFKDNYKIIAYNETAEIEKDYNNYICNAKNLKEAKKIAIEFYKSENCS